MLKQLRPAVVVLVGLTLLTGQAYPLAVTAIAQAIWPHQANGSIITREGRAVGSELIGQPFTDSRYFWPRPSATSPAYNAVAGTGSNLAVSNPALTEVIKSRVAALRASHTRDGTAIPVDLVTASGSGLDPHITPAAAEYQLSRVARARGLPEEDLRKLLRQHTQGRTLGMLGESRVNVLQLNLALDTMAR